MSTVPSLYRRHRPRSFDDVVGQEHVVRTLRNAIAHDKLHHAYLFVGSRGTGKTSMAKILAACLNCVNGPTVEPCGVCDSCVAIASATSMDVIEMDAASNNSVDDIRELRESVAFAPVSGGYKVYILDEAHMLSTQAWNAFLKTLEEPPPSTIFVLATTEASKILPTVVDRCHRFDFARPTADQLSAVVRRVAELESISIGPDAVSLLARHAAGSFRDALGTLEQLVTYSGENIAVEDVLAVLGVADADLLFDTIEGVAAHDAARVLKAAASIAQTGRDLTVFIGDLEAHSRELLIVRTLREVPAEIAVTADRDARLSEQALRVPGADVIRLLDLLSAALRAIKDGADPRTQLELALVKAATPEVDGSTMALLARLERLENALSGGGQAAPPAPAAQPAPAVAREEPEPAAADPVPAAESAPPPPAPPVPQADSSAAPDLEDVPEPVVDVPRTLAVATAEIELPKLLEVWPVVLDTLAEQNVQLSSCLRLARPIALTGRELTIAFDNADAFHRRLADESHHRAELAEAIRGLTGLDPRLKIELADLAELAGGDAAPPPPPSPEEWVDRIKDAFDAEEIVPEQESS